MAHKNSYVNRKIPRIKGFQDTKAPSIPLDLDVARILDLLDVFGEDYEVCNGPVEFMTVALEYFTRYALSGNDALDALRIAVQADPRVSCYDTPIIPTLKLYWDIGVKATNDVFDEKADWTNKSFTESQLALIHGYFIDMHSKMRLQLEAFVITRVIAKHAKTLFFMGKYSYASRNLLIALIALFGNTPELRSFINKINENDSEITVMKLLGECYPLVEPDGWDQNYYKFRHLNSIYM